MRAADEQSEHVLLRHSLRFRLVAVVCAMVVLAIASTVVASALIMQRNLTDQLWNSLSLGSEAAALSLESGITEESQLRSEETLFPLSFLGAGSFQAILAPDGTVLSSSYLTDKYDLIALTPAQTQAFTDQNPYGDYAISAEIPGLGESVVVTVPLALSLPGEYVLISGSTTAPVDSTVRELVTTGILIGLLALTAVVLIGYWSIRRSLLPLERVVRMADEVVAMPLSAGEVMLPARLDTPIDATSEAGRVSIALTRLLDHVEGALNVRHRAEESMQQFIADASHELKNPLAAIRGYADHYAGAPELTADTKGALDRINSEATRMSQLVTDLLLLARMDAAPEPHYTELDLSRVILETVADAHVIFPGHHWRINIPEDPVTLSSDESALRQILLNLTTNAGTHTPSGTTVTISIERTAHTIVVGVRDTGPGIAPFALGRIFEPFTQGNKSLTNRQQGSVGLGLTIARRLTEWLGGTLSVTSGVSSTAFLVELPSTAN